MSTPESSASRDLLAQLVAAAESSSSAAITPSTDSGFSGDVLLLAGDFVDVGYETKRTDF